MEEPYASEQSGALVIERGNLGVHREVRAMPLAGERAESAARVTPTTVTTADRLDALFLVNALSIGGSERKTVRLANGLSARGMPAGVVALNGPHTLTPMLDPVVERWCLERRGKFSPRSVKALASIIEQRRPRVLFTVNLYPALYGAALAAVSGNAAPPIVGLINTTDLGPGQRWQQHLYQHVLKRLDALVYGCELQRNAWGKVSERLSERGEVIYNGVDLQEFGPDVLGCDRAALRREFALPTEAFVFGSVGRLAPAKNHRVLIDALSELRRRGVDAHLVIVGEGSLRESLEQHARDQGVFEAVKFTGPLQDVRAALRMFDVFVLPSLYIETFSNAALEAMAMGTPVILSNIAGAAEMIRDGEQGYLIEPEALPTRLPTLLHELAIDRARLRTLGVHARQRVEQHFDLPGMIERYASIVRRYST